MKQKKKPKQAAGAGKAVKPETAVKPGTAVKPEAEMKPEVEVKPETAKRPERAGRPKTAAKGRMISGAPEIRGLIKRILCAALLLAALVMVFRTDWIVSDTLLDSDASANMILGEKLSRDGGILSPTFRYGTELFVADVQIVYSLLFRVCGDWSLVRFWGMVIMQVLLLAAYGLTARQSRMSLNMFLVSGAALLLPFSVPYGRIVLMHNYYIPHVTLDFLMVGLFLGVRRRTAERAAWWKTALWGAGLCFTGFVAGLEGIRQLMICAAPLLVAEALCGLGEEKGGIRVKQSLPGLVWAGALTVSTTLGYLVNSRVFSEIYSFSSYESQTLIMSSPERREMILEGLLSAVGYEGNVELFELPGLLSVGAVGALILSLALAALTFLRSRDRDARFISAFFLADMAVITCVFIFLGTQEFRYELYYLPVIVWMIPVLGRADGRKAEPEPLNLRGLAGLESPKASLRQMAALAGCALLLANGLYFNAFFRDPDACEGRIPYSGLNVEDPDTVDTLGPIAEYLKENGYTLCYANYWNGGVITELTDGQVRSVPVSASGRKKPIKYQEWLCDKDLWDTGYAAEQKACILADYETIEPYMEEISEAIGGTEEVESINGYTIYELNDPAGVARLNE